MPTGLQLIISSYLPFVKVPNSTAVTLSNLSAKK